KQLCRKEITETCSQKRRSIARAESSKSLQVLVCNTPARSRHILTRATCARLPVQISYANAL
ncbi:hypothetical protein BDV93DRAFT_571797, partial [Ceratobasidium sp. AG-I]